MSDGLIITIIGLVYTASSGVIFYLNQHFFISKKGIRQVVNWPIAKVRDAIVTSILRLFNNESDPVFDSERERVEEFYNTILVRMSEEKKVLSLEKKLKILKRLSMVNIALPMIFLFLIICYLLHNCSVDVSLLSIAQKHLSVLIAFWGVPWIFYFVFYFLSENCKTQLDALEPRNTQERDEE